MKKAVIAVTAVLLVAAGIAGWFLTRPEPATATPTIAVEGTLTVPNGAVDATECELSNGYEDIHQGAQVVVKNDSGKTVGVGDLGEPTLEEQDEIEKYSSFTFTDCVFPFTVTIRPDGSDFYAIRVGGVTRGSLEYSKEELSQPVDLTLK